jgi:hypothetical protein
LTMIRAERHSDGVFGSDNPISRCKFVPIANGNRSREHEKLCHGLLRTDFTE